MVSRTQHEIQEAYKTLVRESNELKLKHKKELTDMKHRYEMMRLDCTHPNQYKNSERDGSTSLYCPDCGLDS